jgi:ATP-binding cassette, subfamily B, bacterial
MHKYRRLIKYALRQWPTLVLILGLTAATTAVTVLQPWPMKLLVDNALGHTAVPALVRSFLESLSISPTPTVLILVAAFGSLGLFILNSALDVGLGLAWAAAGQRMVYDLAADLFHRFQRLSLLFHSRRTVGDSLSRLTGDTWCVYTVTGNLLIAPVQHVLTLVAVGAVAWKLDPHLTLVSLMAAPVLGGSAFFFGRRLKRRTKQDREAQARLLSFLHQTLTAIPVVQTFATEERNLGRYRSLAADAVTRSQRGALVGRSQGLVNGFTTMVGSGIVLYIGGGRVLSGAITVGSLLVFLSYFRSLQNALKGLARLYVSLRSAEANIDRVLDDLEAKEEVREAPDAKLFTVLAEGERGHVLIEKVTFGYGPGHPVIDDITIDIHPGETIAFVGPTGAGKSTLVSLIPRLFDPWKGRVLVDGMDVREAKLSSLRAQISVVLQEPFLLPLTVAENIAYGRPEASRAEIEQAAKAAGANDFIHHLPSGYDTIIGERGATLSGGERQRLSIARALLKDAPILILDEPTSSLDAQTEAQLLEALERLMKGRTTFIIAHRLSTIRRADRIVALKDGRVVEEGTHDELLRWGGLYAGLHSFQTSGSQRRVVA